MSEEKKVYTVEDLAQRWNCSQMTIYRMIETNKLKCFKLGRAVRVTLAEVERYENS